MKRTVPQIQNLAQESKALYDVLNKESDMACVLISASYLDSGLASLLKHYFVAGDTAREILEPPRGFLSSFASRSELAYCLGLIPKGLLTNLQTVGTIRNSFAHSHLMKSFDHPEIAELISRLTFPTIDHSITPDEIGARSERTFDWSSHSDPRSKFTIIVVHMVNFIVQAGLNAKRIEQLAPKW